MVITLIGFLAVILMEGGNKDDLKVLDMDAKELEAEAMAAKPDEKEAESVGKSKESEADDKSGLTVRTCHRLVTEQSTLRCPIIFSGIYLHFRKFLLC